MREVPTAMVKGPLPAVITPDAALISAFWVQPSAMSASASSTEMISFRVRVPAETVTVVLPVVVSWSRTVSLVKVPSREAALKLEAVSMVAAAASMVVAPVILAAPMVVRMPPEVTLRFAAPMRSSSETSASLVMTISPEVAVREVSVAMLKGPLPAVITPDAALISAFWIQPSPVVKGQCMLKGPPAETISFRGKGAGRDRHSCITCCGERIQGRIVNERSCKRCRIQT